MNAKESRPPGSLQRMVRPLWPLTGLCICGAKATVVISGAVLMENRAAVTRLRTVVQEWLETGMVGRPDLDALSEAPRRPSRAPNTPPNAPTGPVDTEAHAPATRASSPDSQPQPS